MSDSGIEERQVAGDMGSSTGNGPHGAGIEGLGENRERKWKALQKRRVSTMHDFRHGADFW